MKSSNAGNSTTATVEVVSVSKHGLWLHVEGEEFFLPFEKYPWFGGAPLLSVFRVELLHGFHLRWPNLDVDLEIDALRHPERYPLRFDPVPETRYAVIIEKAEHNYSAYVPDLPGCVAVGDTIEETERSIQEAIEFHIQGMRKDGLPIPAPTSVAKQVEVYP
jgi:predicted RNase H-like HicB family nuclease